MLKGLRLQRLALPIATILLAACSTPPQQTGSLPAPVISQGTSKQETPKTDHTAGLRPLLQETYKLLEAERYREATARLSTLYYDNLPLAEKPEYALQRAQIAIHRLEANNAFLWLDLPAVLNDSRSGTQIRLHNLRAQAYELYGEYRAAADEWFDALALTTTAEETSQQNQALWSSLIQIQPETLQRMASLAYNTDRRGWLNLALAYNGAASPDEQIPRLQQWLQLWTNHPASTQAREILDLLQQAKIHQPRHIALVLPLSGPLQRAGEAVRDGFMAAFYASNAKAERPEITFFDSNSSPVKNLIMQAKDLGADLVVGPLEKDKVESLYTFEPPLPVLSLNYPQQKTQPSSAIVEFGLSPEEEAIQAARRARLDGHERVVILTPESDWGQRVAASFKDYWEQLDGSVAGSLTYDRKDDITQTTGKLLLVDESNKRSSQLQRVVRQSLNFSGRRRQDIDAVFIAANPFNARQIKPALAYQYAGKLPTYTTSSTFSGTSDPERDADLNGIRIPLMPWLTPGSKLRIPLKADIEDTWPDKAGGSYSSLYALGADSWLIHTLIPQLTELQGTKIQGFTGELYIKDQQVQRKLDWYVFRSGQPRFLGNSDSKRNKAG
ncbi:penicillin-binding protein activator [Spongorhabdus nitratireducens]